MELKKEDLHFEYPSMKDLKPAYIAKDVIKELKKRKLPVSEYKKELNKNIEYFEKYRDFAHLRAMEGVEDGSYESDSVKRLIAKINYEILLLFRELGRTESEEEKENKPPEDNLTAKEKDKKKVKRTIKIPLKTFRELVKSLYEYKPPLFGKESIDNIETIFLNIKENKERVPENIQNRLFFIGKWIYWKEVYKILVFKNVLVGSDGYGPFFDKFCMHMNNKDLPQHMTSEQVWNGCRKKASITIDNKNNLAEIIINILSKNNFSKRPLSQ